MSEIGTDSDQADHTDLRAELREIEAELDALRNSRSGFDFHREIRRVRGIVRSLLGRDIESPSSFEAEALSGQDLVERIQELQRRRVTLKTRLDRLDRD